MYLHMSTCMYSACVRAARMHRIMDDELCLRTSGSSNKNATKVVVILHGSGAWFLTGYHFKLSIVVIAPMAMSQSDSMQMQGNITPPGLDPSQGTLAPVGRQRRAGPGESPPAKRPVALSALLGQDMH